MQIFLVRQWLKATKAQTQYNILRLDDVEFVLPQSPASFLASLASISTSVVHSPINLKLLLSSSLKSLDLFSVPLFQPAPTT